jgi:hypothetical protein
MGCPIPYILTYKDGEERIVYDPGRWTLFSLHVIMRWNGVDLRAVQISSDLIEKLEPMW